MKFVIVMMRKNKTYQLRAVLSRLCMLAYKNKEHQHIYNILCTSSSSSLILSFIRGGNNMIGKFFDDKFNQISNNFHQFHKFGGKRLKIDENSR